MTYPKADAVSHTVRGGYGHENTRYTLGINSGSSGIGFGISDQNHAILTGTNQTTAAYMSLSPDDAERIGNALIAHATAVRERLSLAQEA